MVTVEQREQMRQLALAIARVGSSVPQATVGRNHNVHGTPPMLHLGSSAYGEMGQRDMYFCVTGMY